jgi:hypothetical protein
VFGPCNQVLSFWESRRIPSSHFWECEFHPYTCLKVGLRHCLNSWKVSYVATFFVYSSVVYWPSCVCYCKCWKCFGLAWFPSNLHYLSKCRCSSPFLNLMSCSLLTPWLCFCSVFPTVMSSMVCPTFAPSVVFLVEMSSMVLLFV